MAQPNPVVFFDVTIGGIDAGRIKMELFADKVPRTAENFRQFCTGEHRQGDTPLGYKGAPFHRVIKGFMCQFGCPNSVDPNSRSAGTGGPPPNSAFALPDGTTVSRDAGGNIPDELVAPISNEIGTISMANTGQPNSGGSQFFLNTKHNSFLDYFDASSPSAHPVFGKVIEGMDVVKEIEGVPTAQGDKPVEAVRVETITIEE